MASAVTGLVTEEPIRTTYRQDVTAALLGLWLTLGGFVDGFAHRNLDTPETFFTPWHGILYSGYLAAVVWMLGLMASHRRQVNSLIEAIPDGYAMSAAGLVVFAAGGVGDMFWHIIFGIEVSLDALLSPTHILLLIGAVLFVYGPVRARWRDMTYRPDRLGGFWPPLLGLSIAAAELGFFFQYIDGFSMRFLQVPYVPASDDGFFQAALGISSILITTFIVMGALLLMLRRWQPPFGSGVVMFGLFGVLMEALEGYDFPEDMVAPLAGGLAADLLIRYLKPGRERLSAVRLLAFAVPVLMWGVRFVVFEQFSDIRWPIELWTGTLVFAGLAGVALSLLIFNTEAIEPEGVPTH